VLPVLGEAQPGIPVESRLRVGGPQEWRDLLVHETNPGKGRRDVADTTLAWLKKHSLG